MTTLAKALDGIRVELASVLKELVPNRVIASDDARFRQHARLPGVEITNVQGKARLFQIGDAMPAHDVSCYQGGSHREGRWRIPITICYPRGHQWHIVAMDEIDNLLKRALLETTGTHGVPGVNTRWIESDAQITIEQDPSDHYDYYTIQVLVLSETKKRKDA